MPAILVADRDGRYLDGTEEALVLYGVSLDELRSLEIGAFSGPHAELAVTVWNRLAATGKPMTTGESTVYRRDGSQIRVRYLRIEPRADGAYELEMIEVPAGTSLEVPISDKPSQVLEEWRAAERAAAAGDHHGAAGSVEGLRKLYRHSVDEKRREPTSS